MDLLTKLGIQGCDESARVLVYVTKLMFPTCFTRVSSCLRGHHIFALP